MTTKNTAFLLIGGNTGHRESYLSGARAGIEETCGHTIRVSSIYETAAWGLEAQAPFLNQVLEIKTALTAVELLHEILSLEGHLGRKRDIKYGPRTIDIDILFFNEDVINAKGLTVPHPQMQARRFVLVPLAEVAPEKIHPVLQKTVAQLLKECSDGLPVQKFR